VIAPGPPHEADGERRVDEVADHHPRRGARHHAAENEIGGKLEDADEKAGEDDELGEIVEGEPEERVPVTRREPAWKPPAGGHRYAGRDSGRPAAVISRTSPRTRSASCWHQARPPRLLATSAKSCSISDDHRSP